MIEKILVAVAGAGQAEQMLKALMEIPSISQAHVTILHVVPSQISATAMAQKLEEGGKIMATAIQTLALDPNRSTAMLREGDPKDIVCRVAEEIDADLIIMGSRGLKRLQSILENSVSQYVFQLASRPMLLVKDDIYVKKINRIMVAMDNSTSAQQALKSAIAFLRDIKGGELILVHTNPEMKQKAGEIPTDPNQDPVLIPAATEAKKQGIRYRCIAPTGKPGERICQVAEEMNVDLLMLGSPERRPTVARGLPDLDRLLGQSLSDYVRVYVNCPVMLVRNEA